MFKRVERKRKRREEEEELGLDQDMKETLGLNDTDSDESDSSSEHGESAESDNPDVDLGNDADQEAYATSEDEGLNEDSPISVAEALKDPIYLISLNPTVHGCILCKGKLIKNAGMATVHRNANVHKRRLEHFKLLSADADPRSNAWELIRTTRSASNMQGTGSQELSKRALKRQSKQAAIREKRKHHKELKAKAIAKKALKKLSTVDEARPTVPPKTGLQTGLQSLPAPKSQDQPRKTGKKQKLEASRTKTSNNSKKPVLKTRLSSTRKAKKPS